MAGEPSLSEITSIKGDANIAGGSAGGGADMGATAPVQFDQGLQFLNEAADARQNYNKYLTEQYQKNLTDGLANLQNIDFSKALSSDLPALRQKYADLAKNVADNFDVIRNPGSDPAKASELAQQEADLRSSIQASTVHNGINSYNKKFITENPSFNTQENQDLINNFQSTPLDQRKDFLLKTPYDVNLESVAKTANEVAKQSTNKQFLSKDGKWINQDEAINYDQNKYNDAFIGTMKNTYKNGKSLYDQFVDHYNLMPAANKVDANGNPITPEQYLQEQGNRLRLQGGINSTFKDNPYAIQNQKESFEASEAAKERAFRANQEALNRANQVKLLKHGEIDPNEAGEAKLRTLASAFTSGNLGEAQAQSIYGDNNKFQKELKVFGKNDDGTIKIEKDKIPVPLIQVKGTSIDPQGNLHIHRVDNATNLDLPDIVRSYDQAYSDFDKIYGDSYAPQIGTATGRFSQQKFKAATPTLGQLQQYFSVPKVVTNKYAPINQTDDGIIPQGFTNPTALPAPASTPAPAASGGLSGEAYQNLLRKNGLIK